jgi:transposase
MVIHPADIPTTHKEKDQKRDARDSRKIARAIKNKEVTPIWVPSIPIEQDRQLIRARHSLTKDQTRTKNRIKAILQLYRINYPGVFSQKGSHWSLRFIRWLEELRLEEPSGTEALQLQVRHLQYHRSELLLISKKIKALSINERYEKNCEKLINISGIGVLTAMSFLTEIGDVFRFNNTDAFRSYIGLIPRTNSSGEKDYHGSITHRANSYLRFLLVEAAWVAIRSDPYYLHLYRQYRKRMKDNRALIRVAGKLANRIFYCLKSNKEEK